MLNIPIAVLKAKYQEHADYILNSINDGYVTLVYPPVVLSDPDANFDERPKIIDMYGGRQPIERMPDRFDQSGTNKIEEPLEERIKARTYWEPRKTIKNGNLEVHVDICCVIVPNSYDAKLKNAQYALIDNRQLKLIQGPTQYGLFEKRYSISYWEPFNDNQDN